MSNPFATFRKNQTYWMAALVLVAIMSFVVAPAIDVVTRSFRTGGVDDAVVARWNGGQITQKEVDNALRSRYAFGSFLTGLAKKVLAAGGQPSVPGFFNFNGQIRVSGINEVDSPDDACYSKILLAMAEKIGVEFDDKAADEFLVKFCDKKVSDAEFNELLKNSGLTIFEVRQLIKQDLITSTTSRLLAGASAEPAPGKLWQNYLKLNQQVKVEAYPVLVSSFLDKVNKKPTDSQLQELYESGKNRFSHPDSPDPGFVRRDLANVEYIEANYKAYVDREKSKITDDEIKAEYDRQLASGLLKVPADYKAPGQTPASDLPDLEIPAANPTTPTVLGTTPSTPSNGPEVKPEQPASSEPTTKPEATPTETPTPTPTVEKPASESPKSDSPQPEQPKVESPSVEPSSPAAPGGDAPTAPQSNLIKPARQVSDVRLVSFLQESPAAEAPATTQEPATQSPTPETPATQTPPATPAPGAEVAPQATTPAAGTAPTAATTLQDPATTPATTTPSANQLGGAALPADSTKPPLPQMRDMTFEEARDRIISSLAETRASKASADVLVKLQKQMEEYSQAYQKYQALQTAEVGNKKVEKPTKPDLKKFAEENGLLYGQTGLVDSTQLAVTQFGGSTILLGERSAELAANVVTMPQVDLFRPLNSHLIDQDAYRSFNFWKTESIPAELPPLNDVRDLVQDWWKRLEARKLAEEAAVALQKKIGSGDDPWSAALSENERSLVTSTEPFTWVSRFSGQMNTTNVPKLDRVGEEFMKQVFSTDVGKIGVAANNPKSVFYVYRVVEKTPDLGKLQSSFTADLSGLQGAKQISRSEPRLIDWQALLNQQLNVQFQ